MKLTTSSTRFGTVLQQFFVERLMQQRHASARPIAAYRDCFRLLLVFAERRLGKRPAEIAIEDLNASLVLDFLEYLEKQRHKQHPLAQRAFCSDPLIHALRWTQGKSTRSLPTR